ncbi:MAG TPA: peptidoglycan editing factor PgeF [Candidatus Babeliales bacterium]|nr:peptidoglycan editing factor PgeF [Candidatus Babeliales bacterium]
MKVKQSKIGNTFFHFGTAQETVEDIQRNLQLQSLIILDQTHGVNGHVITENNCHMPFKSLEGDFLVTNQRNIGIAVLTADCLPIIFIDKKNNAVGIAHAGWHGSVNNIIGATLDCMHKNYGTTVFDVAVFLGPCAHVCCYKVGEDFLQHIKPFAFSGDAIVYRDNNLFFDLPHFNKHILLSVGLPQNSIHDEYSKCTICNEEYFSYRRQADLAGRQVSVVSIK